MNRLTFDRAWRLAATGFCFLAFGLGGIFLSLCVFPPLLLLPRAARIPKARKAIHYAFRLFLWCAQALGLMRLHVSGAEHLASGKGRLILANHPTLIDVVALIALMPDVNCVVKRAAWKNPFLMGAVNAAGYIDNASPEQLIQDCAARLNAGDSLIIFPEGTRTRPNEPLRFQRGAAYIVMQQAGKVVPVLIDCTPSTLAKQDKWYCIPSRRFDLTIAVQPAVQARDWVEQEAHPPLAARRLTHTLETYFSLRIKPNGHAQA